MRMTATGGIAIPKNVRETLGITDVSEIDFKEDNGRFYLVKIESTANKGGFAKLRGIATSALSSNEIMALTRES